MAIYCSKCGKELPDDAQFCIKCGKALKESAQLASQQEPKWEYCEITWREATSTRKKRGFWDRLDDEYTDVYFFAEAIGPKGDFKASPDFLGGIRYHDNSALAHANLSLGITDWTPPSLEEEENANARKALIAYLVQNGWEPTGEKNKFGYDKFRRRVKYPDESGGGPKHANAQIFSSASQAPLTPNSVIVPPLPPPPAPAPSKPIKRLPSKKMVVGSLFYGGIGIMVSVSIAANFLFGISRNFQGLVVVLLLLGALTVLAGWIMALVDTARERRTEMFFLILLLPAICVLVYCFSKGE